KEKYIDYDTIENRVLLNIPFVQLKNQSFKVTAYPYFTLEPSLTSKTEQAKMHDISQYQQIDIKEEKAVISFIQSFLDKYVSASLEDMAYIMKEPEILTGNYKIGNSQINPFFKDEQLFAFVTFDVIDGETKIGHKETMTLLLKQRE